MTQATPTSGLEHRFASVLFATTADTTPYESPMKYPPCDCGASICPETKQAGTQQGQPCQSGVHNELRRRVHRENKCRQLYRLT